MVQRRMNRYICTIFLRTEGTDTLLRALAREALVAREFDLSQFDMSWVTLGREVGGYLGGYVGW